MSRYTIRHKDKTLSFGTDHVFGQFLQIWTRPEDEHERKLQDVIGPDPNEMLVDEDEINDYSDNVTLALIEQHGFQLSELEGSV